MDSVESEPANAKYERPGVIFNPHTSYGTDACFDYLFTEFCTHFEPAEGGAKCKAGAGGKAGGKGHTAALSTFDSLVLCDAGVPGCSTDKFVCSGTTAACGTYGPNYDSMCDCQPTVGYVKCDKGAKERPGLPEGSAHSARLRRAFSGPGGAPEPTAELFP
jgi:hypothetical protein